VNQGQLQKVKPMEPGTADEDFENLREHFRQRLRKEQAQLSALAETLARAQVASVSVFVDIRAFAHRLRGAALVFGFQRLGDNAKAVELAAIAASLDLNRQRGNTSVAATMHALATNLAEEIGSSVPSTSTAHATGLPGKSSSC
jgi:hypothetical protein